jgi:hypothetical protein
MLMFLPQNCNKSLRFAAGELEGDDAPDEVGMTGAPGRRGTTRGNRKESFTPRWFIHERRG